MEEKIAEILAQIKELKETALLASKTMLTTDDVSMLTGISVTQLRNLRSKRQIPFYRKTAKLIYYDRGEIDAWMRQNRVNSIDD